MFWWRSLRFSSLDRENDDRYIDQRREQRSEFARKRIQEELELFWLNGIELSVKPILNEELRFDFVLEYNAENALNRMLSCLYVENEELRRDRIYRVNRTPGPVATALALQILSSLNVVHGLYQCAVCGKPFNPPERRPRTGVAALCGKDCQDEQQRKHARNHNRQRRSKEKRVPPE